MPRVPAKDSKVLFDHVMGRLLGLRDGVRLGFWRHLLGQGEKWQILRAHPMPSAATSTYGAAGGALPYLSHTTVEDITARGRYVRIGDCILLQTFRGDHLLSSLDGQARLAARPDRTMLSTQSQSWQIESYGTIPQPLWLNNRPYLRLDSLISICTEWSDWWC